MGFLNVFKKKSAQTQDTVKTKSVAVTKEKTFGIAFAGGGGKGYAHIGALKAMEDCGIPRANACSGTSVGSIIGSAYAMGYTADELYEYAKDINFDTFSYRTLLGVDKFSKLFDKDIRSRFFNITRDSETIENIMTEFYGDKTFSDTLIPFYAVAVDLKTGCEVVLDKGSIAKACRASSSVPGVFTPTVIDDMLLVDGGVLNNMPADVLRDKVDVLLGIELHSDIYTPCESEKTFDVLTGTLEVFLHHARIKNHSMCDLLAEPKLDRFGEIQLDDDSKVRFYEEGYESMMNIMPQLKELLKPEITIIKEQVQ